MFAQRNCLTMHFSECKPYVNHHMTMWVSFSILRCQYCSKWTAFIRAAGGLKSIIIVITTMFSAKCCRCLCLSTDVVCVLDQFFWWHPSMSPSLTIRLLSLGLPLSLPPLFPVITVSNASFLMTIYERHAHRARWRDHIRNLTLTFNDNDWSCLKAKNNFVYPYTP